MRWTQETRVYVARKGDGFLLVLQVQYDTPGRSGFETYPLSERARDRLRQALDYVIELESRSDAPTSVNEQQA